MVSFCSVIGCASFSLDDINKTKPVQGFPAPSSSHWQEVEKLIDTGRFNEAINKMTEKPNTKLNQQLWQNYYLGVAHFKNKNLAEGIKSFEACYRKAKSRPDANQEDLRVVSLCLKKIGWFHRKKKDYAKAFAFHSVRYHYAKEDG